jgi:hypothetical protein
VVVEFQDPESSGLIDGGELIPASVLELEVLDVDLD